MANCFSLGTLCEKCPVELNCHGFSPAQLVFGKNVNLPSALRNKLPALEDVKDYSPVVGLHLNALNAARKAYVAAESSAKVKLALKKQTRPTGKTFHPGETVFYKRDESAKWKGPAIVLGQDNVVVFVRHGARYLKIHTCRLQHANPSNNGTAEENTVPSTVEHTDAELPQEPNSSSIGDVLSGSDSDEEDAPPPHHGVSSNESTPGTSNVRNANTNSLKVKKKDYITFFKDGVTSKLYEAKILGGAGKKNGPLKHWYNIEYYSPESLVGKQISMDLSRVEIQSINDQQQLTSSDELMKQYQLMFLLKY